MIEKRYSRLFLATLIVFVIIVSAPNFIFTGETATVPSSPAPPTLANSPTTQVRSDSSCQFGTTPLGHSIYYAGDGNDYDALEWINVIEARDTFAELSSMPEVTVAIIDTGIDPDVWKYIEDNGGDIVYYVKYQAFIRWHWWPPGFWYDVDGPYEAATYSDSDVWDGHEHGHGSMTASTVWQAAPKAKLLIIDMFDNEGDTILHELAIEKALQWLINNQWLYDVDVVSMSFGGANQADFDAWHDELQTLYNNYGVTFVASSGNDDAKVTNYPASWSEVISVGAIYDDWDMYLTNGMAFNPGYRGYRATGAKSDDYPPHGAFGSTYSDYIDFVAPGFDVEVLDYNSEGYQGTGDVVYGVVDGTSFSCPFAAAAAALVIDAFYDNHALWDPLEQRWYNYEPTPQQVFDFIKQNAESSMVENVQWVPHPETGWRHYILKWDMYVGWGCIDAYDAVLQATL